MRERWRAADSPRPKLRQDDGELCFAHIRSYGRNVQEWKRSSDWGQSNVASSSQRIALRHNILVRLWHKPLGRGWVRGVREKGVLGCLDREKRSPDIVGQQRLDRWESKILCLIGRHRSSSAVALAYGYEACYSETNSRGYRARGRGDSEGLSPRTHLGGESPRLE